MVMNAIAALFGPLAGPECRRALARGWLIVVRTLTAAAMAFVVLSLTWTWWFSAQFESFYSPASDLRIGLSIGALMLLTTAVVMVPAVLAGSLAGERERGVLQLLIATAVRPREIVLGRLAGKLSQVGMVLLAALPALMLLLAWNGFHAGQVAVFVLLLAAVCVGGGGLAMGASVLARRGRDALLGAYLVILALLLSPLVERSSAWHGARDWLESSSPYLSMGRLVWSGETTPALATAGWWLVLGIGGMALASWRLVPSSLGAGTIVKRASRRRRVPPLADRPMLWKELYIERAGTLGRLGRWLGLLLILPIGGGSVVLASIAAWSFFGQGSAEWSGWASDQLAGLLRQTALLVGWLIQWAIGLRAAVSIASERERGTWDAVLTSRLDPGEIVAAKLCGSLYALRWLIGAIVLAWTLGLAVGAIGPGEYTVWIVGNLLTGALMAAVGVRCSLSLATATKAMTWTIALWLGLSAIVAVLALSVICLGMLFCYLLWVSALQLGVVPPTAPPWFPISWAVAWPLATNAVTLLIAVLVVVDTRVRFDRLAGRIAGGSVEAAVDGWLYGQPLRPVRLARRGSKPVKSRVPPLQAARPDDIAGWPPG